MGLTDGRKNGKKLWPFGVKIDRQSLTITQRKEVNCRSRNHSSLPWRKLADLKRIMPSRAKNAHWSGTINCREISFILINKFFRVKIFLFSI